MSDEHKSGANSDLNIDQAPIYTGNKPETQADRENVVFRYPEWVIDRVSATALMLVVVAIVLGVGAFLISFVTKFPFWGN